MTIMELGALGEFLSAIVVVGTLIYLAMEIRQTRRALLASAYQARAEMQMTFGQSMFNSDYLPPIALKVDADEPLEPLEAHRWQGFTRSLYRHHENVFYQHSQGFLEAGALESSELLLQRNLSREVNRRWWESARRQFNPEFARWVDEILSDET